MNELDKKTNEITKERWQDIGKDFNFTFPTREEIEAGWQAYLEEEKLLSENSRKKR